MTETRRVRHYLGDWMVVKGLDTVTLAERADVSRATISKVLGGARFYVSTMKAITEALGIPYEDVFKDPYQTIHRPRQEHASRAAPKPDLKELLDDPDAELIEGVPLSAELRTAMRAILDLWLRSKESESERE